MSVVIPDMEIPSSCYDCPFHMDHVVSDYCAVLRSNLRTDQLITTSACPLEEYKDEVLNHAMELSISEKWIFDYINRLPKDSFSKIAVLNMLEDWRNEQR